MSIHALRPLPARLRASLATLLLAGALAPAAAASGLSVMPTQLRFPVEGGRVQVIQLTNHTGVAASYEIDARVEPDGSDGQDSGDLVVNPSIVTLQPGQQARVRVGLVDPPPADRERAYRLYVSQLPSTTPAAGAVSVLMRIGIPVFVDAPGMKARPLHWKWRLTAKGAVLNVHNPGTRHVRIDAAGLRRGPHSRPLSLGLRYLFPGQSLDVAIDSDAFAGGDARVVFETPDGEQSTPVPRP